MFKRKVTVPRITADAVAEMERIVPGLSTVVKVPVIQTEKEARAAAEAIVEKTLERYEYVGDVALVEETDAGWVVTLNIWGD